MPYGVGVRVPLSAPRGELRRELPFFIPGAEEHRGTPENTGKRRRTPESPLFPTGRRKKRPRKPDFQFIFLFLSMVPNLNGRGRTYYERFVTFSFTLKLRKLDTLKEM